MKTRKLVYEGKGKNLYEGPEPGTLVQYFKDDATAQNGKKTAVLEGKGVLNNRISEYLMSRLTDIGVPNHFMRRLNMREQLIREVEIIPLEVVVRNVAARSMAKRFDMEERTVLPSILGHEHVRFKPIRGFHEVFARTWIEVQFLLETSRDIDITLCIGGHMGDYRVTVEIDRTVMQRIGPMQEQGLTCNRGDQTDRGKERGCSHDRVYGPCGLYAKCTVVLGNSAWSDDPTSPG